MDLSGGILVTGASSCLGRAILEEGLRKNIRPMLATFRSETELVESAPGLEHLNGCDLATEQGVEALRQKARQVFRHPFGVVHCAGYFGGYERVADSGLNSFTNAFSGNVLTFAGLSMAIIPLMRRLGGGAVFAITSHSREQGYPLMGHFEMSKASLCQLVKHLANEEGDSGIQVNSLAISSLDTSRERNFVDPDLLTKPATMATAIVDLLSADTTLLSGNEIHLYKWHEAYFTSGFYERRRVGASHGEG